MFKVNYRLMQQAQQSVRTTGVSGGAGLAFQRDGDLEQRVNEWLNKVRNLVDDNRTGGAMKAGFLDNPWVLGGIVTAAAGVGLAMYSKKGQ
ncbi:hypothetical protein [Salisaeta icosahedral phage 1]|uniref:hypothetical protein n=1 Tax=Salisaeta icosahedral phage 1 TaxID=1183239 RepID=UPI00025EA934|nr:hypothetical protein A322_gp39 [Salisaeta icosahedral phage 1]AFJ21494.1 hypothetical protein [Salisaeta icosahedral phage 1]